MALAALGLATALGAGAAAADPAPPSAPVVVGGGDDALTVVPGSTATLPAVSLTVSARTADTFAVSLIPTTLELTTLGRRGAGEEVNVEVDVLAKYVESMLTEGVVPAGTQEGSR